MMRAYSDVHQHKQLPKVCATVSVHHFHTNMTVSWPSGYIVVALPRSIERHFSLFSNGTQRRKGCVVNYYSDHSEL